MTKIQRFFINSNTVSLWRRANTRNVRLYYSLTLDYTIVGVLPILSVLAVHRPFYISICFSWSVKVFEDLHDYINSLEKIYALKSGCLYTGHGAVVSNPDEKLREYIDHRKERENQVWYFSLAMVFIVTLSC